jgi:hypothetical protein
MGAAYLASTALYLLMERGFSAMTLFSAVTKWSTVRAHAATFASADFDSVLAVAAGVVFDWPATDTLEVAANVTPRRAAPQIVSTNDDFLISRPRG